MVFISITVHADGFIGSVGCNYSKSDYGSSESTDVFYMPFTSSYETGAFTYGLTVPWIRDSGLGNIVPSGFGISGSGETDYAVQANVDKYFGAPYVSVGLGYKWLGEPNGVSYDNVVYSSLGGGYKFSKDTSR